MPKTDAYEQEILSAFEQGELKSVATNAELAKFKAAARATGIKDRRVNICLSSGDLSDIQAKALAEGVPAREPHDSVRRGLAWSSLRARSFLGDLGLRHRCR